MKKKNLFDILENAENDSMKRLIDKCPEISDEQLEKIFKMSERKFRKQRAEKERTERDDTINITHTDVVTGVEHISRPAWLTPLTTAASILLIAGIAIGSTVMLRRHSKSGLDGGITPAVTVTTSTETGTNIVSTDENGSTITGTAVATTTTTAVIKTDSDDNDANSEETADTEFIKPFVGRWRYEMSNMNNLAIPESVDIMGIAEINSDATYTYTDISGNVTHGTISNFIGEIGGTQIQYLDFSQNEYSANDFLSTRASYVESRPYELHFSNSNIARLVREEHIEPVDTSWKAAYRQLLVDTINRAGEAYNDPMWDLQDIDGDDIPEFILSSGTAQQDYVMIFYYENGKAIGINNTVQVLRFGDYGVTQISKEDHYIGYSYVDNIGVVYDLTRFEDHYPYNDMFIHYHKLENPDETPYGLNGRPISEDEYNKKVAEFNSKNWITVGRRYYIENFSPLLDD